MTDQPKDSASRLMQQIMSQYKATDANLRRIARQRRERQKTWFGRFISRIVV